MYSVYSDFNEFSLFCYHHIVLSKYGASCRVWLKLDRWSWGIGFYLWSRYILPGWFGTSLEPFTSCSVIHWDHIAPMWHSSSVLVQRWEDHFCCWPNMLEQSWTNALSFNQYQTNIVWINYYSSRTNVVLSVEIQHTIHKLGFMCLVCPNRSLVEN